MHAIVITLFLLRLFEDDFRNKLICEISKNAKNHIAKFKLT